MLYNNNRNSLTGDRPYYTHNDQPLTSINTTAAAPAVYSAPPPQVLYVHKPPRSTAKKCCICCCILLLIILIVIGALIPFLIQIPTVHHNRTDILSCNNLPPSASNCYRPTQPGTTTIIARSYLTVDNGNILQGDVKSVVSIRNRADNSYREFGRGILPSTTVKSRAKSELIVTTTFLPSTDTDAMVIALYGPNSSGEFPINVKGEVAVYILSKTVNLDINEDSVIRANMIGG